MFSIISLLQYAHTYVISMLTTLQIYQQEYKYFINIFSPFHLLHSADRCVISSLISALKLTELFDEEQNRMNYYYSA
jgi:hypothetical protein